MFQNPVGVCALVLLCFGATGCTRVVVHKNPGEHDKGIRYYRPKPYLFITPDSSGGGGDSPTFTINQLKPVEVNITNSKKEKSTDTLEQAKLEEREDGPIPKGQANAGNAPEKDNGTKGNLKNLQGDNSAEKAIPGSKISMKMVYLPDFAEEYSIQLRPGMGIGELDVKLENGWNLTSVGIKTDQQTDEIIKSTADLVSAVGGLGVGGKPKTSINLYPDQKIELVATNIPFGFYEAVIATDPRGRKQLYGWRYIGFMPFQSCPVEPMGGTSVCCADPDAIYGMVMEPNGVLMFKKIAELPTLHTKK